MGDQPFGLNRLDLNTKLNTNTSLLWSGDSPLWEVKRRLSSVHGVEWRHLHVGEMAKSTNLCKVGLGMRV